jgi:hypothetical protein
MWLDPGPPEDGGERGELGVGAGEATNGAATSSGIISPRPWTKYLQNASAGAAAGTQLEPVRSSTAAFCDAATASRNAAHARPDFLQRLRNRLQLRARARPDFLQRRRNRLQLRARAPASSPRACPGVVGVAVAQRWRE